MRVVRAVVAGEATPRYGIIDGDNFKPVAQDSTPQRQSAEVYPLATVRILSPAVPSKIVAIGLNYKAHAEEMGKPLPTEPLIFLKPASAVIGHNETIVLPRMSERVDYEGELALVIGRTAKDVPPEKVREHIMGYTCFNDVTARDLQSRDIQYTRAKGFDTFAPIGPWIETDVDDPNALNLVTTLNGAIVQSTSTADMIFPINVLVSFVSSVMTLNVGDVITTGTPSGIGRLRSGDIVAVSIDGIGTLSNTVA